MNKNKLQQTIQKSESSNQILDILHHNLPTNEYNQLITQLKTDYQIQIITLNDKTSQPMWVNSDMIDEVTTVEFKSIMLDYL